MGGIITFNKLNRVLATGVVLEPETIIHEDKVITDGGVFCPSDRTYLNNWVKFLNDNNLWGSLKFGLSASFGHKLSATANPERIERLYSVTGGNTTLDYFWNTSGNGPVIHTHNGKCALRHNGTVNMTSSIVVNNLVTAFTSIFVMQPIAFTVANHTLWDTGQNNGKGVSFRTGSPDFTIRRLVFNNIGGMDDGNWSSNGEIYFLTRSNVRTPRQKFYVYNTETALLNQNINPVENDTGARFGFSSAGSDMRVYDWFWFTTLLSDAQLTEAYNIINNYYELSPVTP